MHNVLNTVKTHLLMGSISFQYTFRRRPNPKGLYLNDMPKFNFDVPAALDSTTTYNKIKTVLQGENDFKKFDPEVKCTFDEARQSCHISGKQFKASLVVKSLQNTQSVVSIEVELPLALTLFKAKIQEAIEKNIKKIV